MGQPIVTWDNVWAVYLDLLCHFRLLEEIPHGYHAKWLEAVTVAFEEHTNNGDQFDLVDNLQDLPKGDRPGGFQYMGGVNNGLGLGMALSASTL